jgi:hypothetical protein
MAGQSNVYYGGDDQDDADDQFQEVDRQDLISRLGQHGMSMDVLDQLPDDESSDQLLAEMVRVMDDMADQIVKARGGAAAAREFRELWAVERFSEGWDPKSFAAFGTTREKWLQGCKDLIARGASARDIIGGDR